MITLALFSGTAALRAMLVLFYYLNLPRTAMKASFSGKEVYVNAHMSHNAGEYDVYQDMSSAT